MVVLTAEDRAIFDRLPLPVEAAYRVADQRDSQVLWCRSLRCSSIVEAICQDMAFEALRARKVVQ